jgi:ribosomal protein S18 acetylase RimI-like enzyme
LKSLKLEKLDAGHYVQLVELWRQANLPYKPRGRDSLAELSRQLGLPQIACFGLLDGSVMVGSVLATHDGRKGWINRLTVRSGYQRHGLAKQLVRACEQWFTEQKISIFACIIEAGNDASYALFESLGYDRFEGASYYTRRVHPDV